MCINIADDLLCLKEIYLSRVSVVGLCWKGKEDGGDYHRHCSFPPFPSSLLLQFKPHLIDM